MVSGTFLERKDAHFQQCAPIKVDRVGMRGKVILFFNLKAENSPALLGQVIKMFQVRFLLDVTICVKK